MIFKRLKGLSERTKIIATLITSTGVMIGAVTLGVSHLMVGLSNAEHIANIEKDLEAHQIESERNNKKIVASINVLDKHRILKEKTNELQALRRIPPEFMHESQVIRMESLERTIILLEKDINDSYMPS